MKTLTHALPPEHQSKIEQINVETADAFDWNNDILSHLYEAIEPRVHEGQKLLVEVTGITTEYPFDADPNRFLTKLIVSDFVMGVRNEKEEIRVMIGGSRRIYLHDFMDGYKPENGTVHEIAKFRKRFSARADEEKALWQQAQKNKAAAFEKALKPKEVIVAGLDQVIAGVLTALAQKAPATSK